MLTFKKSQREIFLLIMRPENELMTCHYNGYLVKGHREPSGGWKDLDLDLDRGGGHLGVCMCKSIPLGIVRFIRGSAWGTQEPLQSPPHNSPRWQGNSN